MSYAGDVTCKECFQYLQETDSAQLVDVRTMPEWMFVGFPDLSSLGKRLHTIQWQQFPNMSVNPEFVEAVENALAEAGADKASKVFFLCRSGVRSIAAAKALTAAGFAKAFNVLEGFEGNPDQHGHRGTIEGWKFHQLPWVQR